MESEGDAKNINVFVVDVMVTTRSKLRAVCRGAFTEGPR